MRIEFEAEAFDTYSRIVNSMSDYIVRIEPLDASDSYDAVMEGTERDEEGMRMLRLRLWREDLDRPVGAPILVDPFAVTVVIY